MSSTKSNNQSLQAGTIYLTISGFVFMLSGYILNIWLGKYLGPAFYGVYGVIISLMNAFTVMQTSGLPQATSKFIAEDESRSDAVLRTSIVVQLVSTLAISLFFYLCAGQLAAAFHDLSLTPYFRLTSLVFPAYGLFALYTGYYNGQHDFRRQAIMYTIYSIVKAAGIILLVIYFGLYGAVIGFIISPAVSLLYGFVIPKGRQNFSYRQLILFSLPLIGYAIISTFQTSADLFFVKALLTDHASVGYYTAAQNIARIPYYTMGAFALVVFPAVSKGVSENPQKVKGTIENLLRYALIVVLPLTLLIVATPNSIIRLLYSSAYLPGSASLIVLLLGTGLFTLFGILANILSGSGRPCLSVAYSLIGTIIIVGLCLLLIPRFGLTGAAWATTLGCFVSTVLSLASVIYYFGIRLPLSSLVKILGASGLVYLLLFKVSVHGLWLPLLYAAVILVYALFLYLLRELRGEDFVAVKRILPVWLLNRINN